MAEFTQTMSGDSRYSIKLTVTEVIPSDYITTNKTNVNYTLTATKSGGSGYWSSSAINPVKVTINGTDVVNTNISYDFRNATPKTITLASGTVTGISHNVDGTKTIAVSGYFKDSANSLGQATTSGNLTLTTIPRASQPTLYDLNDNIRTYATLGENLKIETFRASTSFTHTIQIKIGNTAIETFNDVGAEKNPWSPSLSTYAPYITNGSSTTATIVCTTYNGSTSLGTKSQTITINVPDNSSTKPTVEITASESNSAVPSSWGVYVKGKSKLSIALKLTPKYSAKINSCSSNANNNLYSWTNSDNTSGVITKTWTTNELTNDGTITASVNDKRGFSNSVSSNYTVVGYSNPQITTYDAYRCNSDGTLNDSGTCIKWAFKGNISSVNNKNSKTFTLKYKPSGGSEVTVGTWNNSYTCNRTAIIQNLSASTEYTFTFTATDQFSTTTSTKVVGTGFRLMNFNGNGKSMAIGGVSQRGANDKYLDVYTNGVFHKPVYFSNSIQVPTFTKGCTINNSDSTGYWYVCDITTTGQYQNQFFEFDVYQRNRYGSFAIIIVPSGTSGALTVSSAVVTRGNTAFQAYYYCANNKLQIYVEKSERYDDANIYVRKGSYMDTTNITWKNTTVTSLPSGYVTMPNSTQRINVSATAISVSDAISVSGDITNKGFDMFNDTSGSDWQVMLKNKLDYCVNNMNTSKGNTMMFINGGWSGVNYGCGIFSKIGTNYQVVWFSTDGIRYCRKVGSNYEYRATDTNNTKGCAMLQLTSNWSFSGVTAWVDTQVAFSGRSGFLNSNSSLFEQSGNGIKCKFAGWVQITGVVSTDKTNEFDACILKGSTQLIRPVNTGGRQSFATAVFQVANGDTVYLGFASDNTSGTIYNNTNFTITRIS